MPQKSKTRASKSKAKSPRRGQRESDAKTQSARFIEAARAIGVDESGKEFERAIKKIAKKSR
jgi:hypothetical protein